MACLGGRAELSVLQAATGEPVERGGPAAGARPGRGCPGGRAGGACRRCGSVTTASARWSWPGWIRSGDASCNWPWRGGWPRRRSCSRSRLSSTCRWSTRSTTPRSGEPWWGCCGAPPTRRALIGDHALVNALLVRRAAARRPGRDRHAGRGAHRPARRPVRHGAPGRGGRGIPHHRGTVPGRAGSCGGDRGAGAQPDPPEPLGRGGRPGRGVLRELGIGVPAADRFPAEARPPVRRPVPVAR